MKRTIMTNTDTFEQPNTGANEESLRMVSAAPVGNEPVSDEDPPESGLRDVRR